MKYSEEKTSEIQEECHELFQMAWDEVDSFSEYMDLDPNWDLVFKLEDLGMWRTFCIRSEDDLLVGVMCVVIQPLIHSQKTIHGLVDVTYVRKESRGNFRDFSSWVEGRLKESGVQVLSIHLKEQDPRNLAMDSMGFNNTERVYSKGL